MCKRGFFLVIVFFVLFLVACGDGGTSEPILYPEQSLATSSSDALESSDAQTSSSNLSSSSSSTESSSSEEEIYSSSENLYISYGKMTDERDGQIYKTVTVEGKFAGKNISRQTWMAQNLNYAYLQPTSEWDSSSFCVEGDCDYFGRVYTWSAAMDSAGIFSETSKGCGFYDSEEKWYKCPAMTSVRGVCPAGWRLPNYNEAYNFIFCRMGSMDFNYDQLFYGVNEDYLEGNTNYWLLKETSFAYAYVDNYSPSSLAHTEGFPLSDYFYSAKKSEFHSVRCIKDE